MNLLHRASTVLLHQGANRKGVTLMFVFNRPFAVRELDCTLARVMGLALDAVTSRIVTYPNVRIKLV
jgi:hypothetical protein